jgi:hypothetical protein
MPILLWRVLKGRKGKLPAWPCPIRQALPLIMSVDDLAKWPSQIRTTNAAKPSFSMTLVAYIW